MYHNPYEHLSGEIDNPRIAKAGFRERHFAAGQIRLNYIVGPNNGPALVLIPAQTGTWESYKKVLIPLSHKFQVYAVDIRGHGKSSWTPGNYSWKSVGADMKAFLEGVVQQQSIVAGSSSGGIIALWCAANVAECVRGIVLEDAPVFSAEMPRFKEEDLFVYNGLRHLVDTIGDPQQRDLADYFCDLKMPVSEKRVKEMPDWLVNILSRQIKRFVRKYPGRPIEVGFPDTLRMLIKSMSMFDPDFARAFVDGRFYEGMNHEEALRRVKCPMLILHANWHRYPKYGLVGAMDDKDVGRILEIVPYARYIRIPANHVIHVFRPEYYINAVENFAADMPKAVKVV